MSHEIYYTSAPEGLKSGSSGFCTVAASEQIPKALWDRLESLSAYRHHFDMGARSGIEHNPVSHAHWILSVAGKTYHVLSRVGDSGVDHTQRTNAFAHHVVLDNAEIQAAPGGPAWMLDQAGMMAESWDGTTRALARGRGNALPKGDIFSADRVCRAWEELTGDAGWGGHLADGFVRTPARPVCILFSAGQDMLPLIAEALALLPPAARWNVTFNTYFTSMPTSATCLWRCCLAGTPAAQIGLRYAANGLVLDLTDRSRLPILPSGPYVGMARTGQAVEAAPKGVPQSRAAKSEQERLKLAGARVPAPKGAVDEDGAREEQSARAQSSQRAAPDRSASAGAGSLPLYELTASAMEESTELPIVEDSAGSVRGPRTLRRETERAVPERLLRDAEEALADAERDSNLAAQRRRKQVLLLFASAFGAIGLGAGLIYWVHRRMTPPEAPILSDDLATASPHRPPDNFPEKNPLPETPVGTGIPNPVAITAEIQGTTGPANLPPPLPMLTKTQETITLASLLERPNVGTGIGDSVQTISLKAQEVAGIESVTALRVHFPRARDSKDELYHGGQQGTLWSRAGTRAGKSGAALLWRAQGDAREGVEVMFIAFNRAPPGVEFQWHSAMVLKYPDMVSVVYWALQNSAMELMGVGTQQIRLKAFEPKLDFSEGIQDIAWPVDLPRDAIAVPPVFATASEGGWQATWYTDWEVKDAALRSAENASQVIKLKKTTGAAVVDSWFLITFKPGFGKVESTYARRAAANQSELAQFESELRAIDAQIAEARVANAGLTATPVPGDLLTKREQTATLIAAYRQAANGYNELSPFDVAMELPDGVRLTKIHFQRASKLDSGK